MAFERKTYSKHYTALSIDAKDTDGIGEGSTCSELDTGKELKFSGTDWVQIVTATSIVGSLAKEDGTPVVRVVIDANSGYNEDSKAINVALKTGPALAVEQLTISTTAVALTPTVYLDTTHAIIQVESVAPTTDVIRYYYNGTAPTSTAGMIGVANEKIIIADALDLSRFKAIKGNGSANDLKINVTYSY